MTTYNKASLKSFFETNDVPTGSDYSNFIDSYVNIVETTQQNMSGALYSTKIITPLVSATNTNAITANVTTVNSTNIISTNSQIVSATDTHLSVNGTLKALCDVSAEGYSVYSSALRPSTGVFFVPSIVSATGSTQATAATITATITRGQGSTDGTDTGFILQSNKIGLVQYFVHEGVVSANLYPCVGGTINGLSANAPFALAANTPYIIIHKTASAYAVK